MKLDMARTKLGVAVIAAFFGGLLFAAGFDMTPLTHAQAGQSSNALIIPAGQRIDDIGSSFTAIAEAVTPAVVSIQARSEPTPGQQRGRQNLPPGWEQLLPPGFEAPQPQEAVSSGTGFIVSADGYILTNNHVITRGDRRTQADQVTVRLNDGRSFPATIVGNDWETDVAVLKIEATGLSTVPLGDDANTRIGEWVVAIGNPLQLDFTVTAGIVSAKGRSSESLRAQGEGANYAITDFIQTDAAINPGNSGGPLLNIRGEVIGINSAIASRTGYFSGYGFAIPITLASNVMNDLIRYGRVRASVLGVSIRDITPDDAGAAGLQNINGVLVQGFGDPGMAPAERAGIEVGDVIVAIDGKPVDRVNTLQRTIRSYEPGATVNVQVMRFGTPRTFSVRLAERSPEPAAVAARPAAPERSRRPTGVASEKLGIAVEPLTAASRAEERLEAGIRGIRVTEVDASGPAGQVLLEGDVITEVINPGPRRAIQSEDEFRAVLNRLKAGDYITLMVMTRGGPALVNLKVSGE